MKPNLMPFKTLLRLFNVFFTCSTADTLIVLSLVDDALEDSSTGVSLVCSPILSPLLVDSFKVVFLISSKNMTELLFCENSNLLLVLDFEGATFSDSGFTSGTSLVYGGSVDNLAFGNWLAYCCNCKLSEAVSFSCFLLACSSGLICDLVMKVRNGSLVVCVSVGFKGSRGGNVISIRSLLISIEDTVGAGVVVALVSKLYGGLESAGDCLVLLDMTGAFLATAEKA